LRCTSFRSAAIRIGGRFCSYACSAGGVAE
jgi:hypothetical protein